MKKICSRCKIEKELSEFHKTIRTKSGVHSQCKTCTKERIVHRRLGKDVRRKDNDRTKKYRSGVRQKWYNYCKDKCCIICGESRLPCLQFNHRDPSKKEFNISIAVGGGYGWNRILKEIEKCEILCANCHAIKTAEQFNWYKDLPIGTNTDDVV